MRGVLGTKLTNFEKKTASTLKARAITSHPSVKETQTTAVKSSNLLIKLNCIISNEINTVIVVNNADALQQNIMKAK